jgi:hypothetical protein
MSSNNNNKNRKGYEDAMYSDLVDDKVYYLRIFDEDNSAPKRVTLLSKEKLQTKPFTVVRLSLEYKDESFSLTGTLNDDIVEIILPNGDGAVLLKKTHSGGKRSTRSKRSRTRK